MRVRDWAEKSNILLLIKKSLFRKSSDKMKKEMLEKIKDVKKLVVKMIIELS